MALTTHKPQRSSRRLAVIFIVVLLVLVLLKVFANFMAAKTTQISPNIYSGVNRLIGHYVEQDANHRPMPNPATIKFMQIIENGELSKYVVLSYLPSNGANNTHILFESLKVNNMFTSNEDKRFGFDGVLKPKRFLNDTDLNNFTSIWNVINKGAVFPEGCEFRASNYSLGGNLAYKWASTESCNCPNDQSYIHGAFNRNGVALRVKLEIRTHQSVVKINTNGYNAYFRKTSAENN